MRGRVQDSRARLGDLPADAPSSESEPVRDAVIIGGGIAGLAAPGICATATSSCSRARSAWAAASAASRAAVLDEPRRARLHGPGLGHRAACRRRRRGVAARARAPRRARAQRPPAGRRPARAVPAAPAAARRRARSRSRARARACASRSPATSAWPGRGPANRPPRRGGGCSRMATPRRSPSGSGTLPGDADLMFRATVTRSTGRAGGDHRRRGHGLFRARLEQLARALAQHRRRRRALIDGIAAELAGRCQPTPRCSRSPTRAGTCASATGQGGVERSSGTARDRGHEGLRRGAPDPRPAGRDGGALERDPVRADRRHGDAHERDAADAVGRPLRARDSQARVQHALQHRQRAAAAQRRCAQPGGSLMVYRAGHAR